MLIQVFIERRAHVVVSAIVFEADPCLTLHRHGLRFEDLHTAVDRDLGVYHEPVPGCVIKVEIALRCFEFSIALSILLVVCLVGGLVVLGAYPSLD